MIEDASGREFLDKARFVGQRFGQLSQILSTVIHFYRQVIQEKFRIDEAQLNTTVKDFQSKVEKLYFNLRDKRQTVSDKQDAYFKTADLLEKEAVLAQTEPSSDKLKSLRKAKAASEEAYKNEFVMLLERVSNRMVLLFKSV